MLSRNIRSVSIFLVLCSILLLHGCATTALLEETEPLKLEKPLTSKSDQYLEVILDWVVIRNGAGSWAENADWDEYLLRVINHSEEDIGITSVMVYDSMNFRQQSSASWPKLVELSHDVVERYEGQDLKVRAGTGGEIFYAAAGVAAAAGLGAGVAAVGASSLGGIYSAAGVANAAIIVIPIMLLGGVLLDMENFRIDEEMTRRHTSFPVTLPPAQEKKLNIFFPLTPSPRVIEIRYANSTGEQKIYVDTRAVLSGLHLGASAEE